ncbi:alpha/beta hydrolase [Dactylosporangium vinaceum]|uniref:Alpha/beta fold hydrolase n=1 Tax=Dactylosporangium vinaceum TaxID=53362 RepID=A0ABV5MNX9_9ACTN|nr:alpha/beta hydrolase [Dactylosporangium vinaceum]UAB95720.1 alpha/beta hydrolase [Dactylosporangium vinaceum]
MQYDTLRVSDATIYYELRGHGPLLVLVGAPMGTRFFAPAADLLAADHTVLTTDPRGIGASVLDTAESDSTPEARADDLARLIAHVDAGPAAVFGSSGGAVTALALAQRHPGVAHTVIAHEPPVTAILPDREERNAAVEDIIATYESGDPAGAWKKFMINANIHEGPPPGPEPDAQQLADERFWFRHEMRGTTHFAPDISILRDGATTVRVALGVDSAGQLLDRTSHTLAELLGQETVPFPGGHIAFVMDPPGFVARLREVLLMQ